VAGVVAFQVSKLFPHSKPNPPDTVQSATNDIPTESIRVSSEVSIDRTESDNLDRTRSLSAIWEKSKHAIFLLETFVSAGEQIGLGTAFSISGNGKLVTNLHVIKNAESVTAKTTNGERFKVESVLAFSKDNDLAILKIAARELSYLDIDFNLPDVGADILVLGSPLGLEGSLSNGVVAAIRKDNESVPSDLIQITAPISPGSSGSPVMNRNGLVVGVATLASTKGAQNLNFAVPSAKISDLQNHLLKTSISISELRNLLEDDAEIEDSRFWEDFHTAVDEKDSDLARDLAEKLVKKYPDNPIPRIALGEIFLGMALFDEAIEHLREAVDLDEKSVRALTSLGIALHARFRTTEAIKYLEKAVVIQPDYEKALLGLAEAYLQAGNVTAALAVARQAAEFYPLNQLLATRISEM